MPAMVIISVIMLLETYYYEVMLIDTIHNPEATVTMEVADNVFLMWLQ